MARKGVPPGCADGGRGLTANRDSMMHHDATERPDVLALPGPVRSRTYWVGSLGLRCSHSISSLQFKKYEWLKTHGIRETPRGCH